jgi:hypothetical protein
MIDTAGSYVLQTPSGGWFVSRDPRDLIKVLQIEIDKKAKAPEGALQLTVETIRGVG